MSFTRTLTIFPGRRNLLCRELLRTKTRSTLEVSLSVTTSVLFAAFAAVVKLVLADLHGQAKTLGNRLSLMSGLVPA